MTRVFLDYDQKALDDAYDQSVYAPNRAQLLARFASTSEAVRRRLGPPQRLSYGKTPVEGMDLYPAKRSNAPVNLFVHGGAWRAGAAKDYAFPAEVLVRAGAHYAALDLVPEPLDRSGAGSHLAFKRGDLPQQRGYARLLVGFADALVFFQPRDGKHQRVGGGAGLFGVGAGAQQNYF